MRWTESVCHRAVETGVLRSIHASDQEMYPAALPFGRLQGWVDSAPWLSIEFVVNATPIGVVVALPVQQTKWEALLSGGLKETDIEAPRDFGQAVQGSDQGQDHHVGIHIFHVERYGVPQAQDAVQFRGFGAYAVGAVLDAARAKGHTILGTSALTATEDGHRAFGRMGFRPTGYEEVWIDGEAPSSGTNDTLALPDDGRQVSRARMMRRDEAAQLGDA